MAQNIMNIARDILKEKGFLPQFVVKNSDGPTFYVVKKIEFYDWSPYGIAYGVAHYKDGQKYGRIANGGCFSWRLDSVLDKDKYGVCETYIKSRTGTLEDGYHYKIKKGTPCE